MARPRPTILVVDDDEATRQGLGSRGLEPAGSLEALVGALQAPRIIWLMVPAGEMVDTTIAGLVGTAAFLALGALGYATLWMAVVADMGTSLLVILNGMRLLTDHDREDSLSRHEEATGRSACVAACCGKAGSGR